MAYVAEAVRELKHVYRWPILIISVRETSVESDRKRILLEFGVSTWGTRSCARGATSSIILVNDQGEYRSA